LAVFEGRYSPLAGLSGAAGSAATVYCTSMIYASLRAVQAWNTRLTPACYLLFAAAGGCLLGAFFALAAGQDARMLPLLALIGLSAAWGVKFLWRRNMRMSVPLSSPESATGLGSIGRVRLFEAPHVNDNYLTREM